jgi:hypothetical protein
MNDFAEWGRASADSGELRGGIAPSFDRVWKRDPDVVLATCKERHERFC